MWDLPGRGIEPVSPALAGGFLTTTPPGKSRLVIYLSIFHLPSLKLKLHDGRNFILLATIFLVPST